MRKLVALFVVGAFAGSVAGPAWAQTSPAPAAPAEKKAEKSEKKMASKSLSGKVKSASADSLVLQGKGGESTFALDPATKIKRGGKDASAADLKEGDAVSVRYMEHDGKKVAQSVTARAEAAKTGEAKKP